MDEEPSAGWYADGVATFGDRIAAAREARGLTQAQVAAQLGVRARTLRSWEDDQAEPRANRLQMLAGVLGVSLRWLMTGEGAGAPSERAAGAAEGQGPAVDGILEEMRAVRADMMRNAERLSRLEARLRAAAGAA